ncbi:hypothetical protein ACHQM5_017091 [Ranunculus cassubicifolius]
MGNKKKADLNKNNNQVFLEHKKKKKWVDEESGYDCIMFYPRALYITWSSRVENWNWNCFKETSGENIEVVKLNAVCWLDVRGKHKISDLSPGVDYEIVYVVKLKNGAAGWELPITLKLTLPNGTSKERKISLLEKPRGEWIELNVGNFLAQDGESREVCFDVYDHGGHWKSGLIIKGAIIRPKA